MKSVLLSIQPKWCDLIASGKKTVEVRKTKPKLETPFKVYIYCTKGETVYLPRDIFGNEALNGKVIGEFVCKRIDRIGKRGFGNNFDYCYLSLNVFGNDDIEIEITDIKKSCIPKNELNSYGVNSNALYAWHISDLVFYDKPKELSDFYKHDDSYDNAFGWAFEDREKRIPITRPPQSWWYVEELKLL